MDYLQMQQQRRIRRIWYAYAYSLAALALYFLAVIWQMAAAMHVVLVQAGEINTTTGAFVLPASLLGFHSGNLTWCNPVNPVGMQFNDFAMAAWPANWGIPLQRQLYAQYCNQPVPSWVYQMNATPSFAVGNYGKLP